VKAQGSLLPPDTEEDEEELSPEEKTKLIN